MKGIVAYDSYYGNSKLVAEAILEQMKAEGHDGEIRNVKEDHPSPPQGDFMFVGSPIRMGSVTGKIKRFVKKLDRDAWKDRPIVVFTTNASPPKADASEKESAEKWIMNRALKLRDVVKDRGLSAVDNVLRVEVKDSKGPLVDDCLARTKQFTHESLQGLKK